MSDQDILLKITAASVSDLEKLKLAVMNRLRELTRTGADKDGAIRGLGLDQDHEIVTALRSVQDALAGAETTMVKVLEHQVKSHPAGGWADRVKGAGRKTTGRLLGAIGDPYIRAAHDDLDGNPVAAQPRTLAQLYAYCGMSVSEGRAPVHRRGVKGTWSDEARMRLYVMAERQVIGGDYRDVYDRGRDKYEEAVHTLECVRCGPSGKPAQPGSPLSKAHQHARAMRLVSKALLRDLYRESRDFHARAAELDAQTAKIETELRTRLADLGVTVPAAPAAVPRREPADALVLAEPSVIVPLRRARKTAAPA